MNRNPAVTGSIYRKGKIAFIFHFIRLIHRSIVRFMQDAKKEAAESSIWRNIVRAIAALMYFPIRIICIWQAGTILCSAMMTRS